jgi:hypothetical protein
MMVKTTEESESFRRDLQRFISEAQKDRAIAVRPCIENLKIILLNHFDFSRESAK